MDETEQFVPKTDGKVSPAAGKNEARIEETARACQCKESTKKNIIGIVIVCCLSVSWVGAQQFAQTSVTTSSNFSAPYFVTWFNTSWMTLCYPLYIIFAWLLPKIFKISEDMQPFTDVFRSSMNIFNGDRLTVTLFFTRIFPMNALWLGVNCAYIYALSYIAATDASAVLSCNVAFVYILSLVIFKNFFILRLLATAICMSGVVLFASSSGFSGGSLIGVVLAVLSALGSASYQVIFKRLVGSATLGQVSLYLSLLGVCNVVFFWIIALILHISGTSVIDFHEVPWKYLIGSAVLTLAFNFLVNFGIAYTYPLFISISMMLGIPLNAVVDTIFKDVEFTFVRIMAAILILLGFALMLVPDSYNYTIQRRLGCARCTPNEEEELDVAANEPFNESSLSNKNDEEA